MSRRQPAVLRGGSGEDGIREHLIATAARMIEERGSANLTVRDIAHEASVADGVLYNHFADKEELLALALKVHVEAVMSNAGPLPAAGVGDVADNLCDHVVRAVGMLMRILPVFSGLLTQPKVIARFHELAGFGMGHGGLPGSVADYLRAEQELGRLAPGADIGSATTMLVGACHELVLPRMFTGQPAGDFVIPTGFAQGLATTVLQGIAPRPGSGNRTPNATGSRRPAQEHSHHEHPRHAK